MSNTYRARRIVQGESHDNVVEQLMKKISGDHSRRPRTRRGQALGASVGAALMVVASACGGGSGGGKTADGFAQAKQSNGKLTVWVDADRMPAAQLYQKQHPDVKMDIVSYDGDANGSNYLQTKVSLFNRTGSGWPDVVFSSQNNETTWAVQAELVAFTVTALGPVMWLAPHLLAQR